MHKIPFAFLRVYLCCALFKLKSASLALALLTPSAVQMLQKLKETRLHDTNLLALLRFECAQSIGMSNVYVVFALKLFLPSTARMEGSWTTFQDVLASWFTKILINLQTEFFVVANCSNKMKKKHPLQSGIKLLISSLVTTHVVLSKPAVVHSDSAGGCDGYK